MKKLMTGLALMLIATTSYAESYTCTGYIDTKAIEPIKITASKVAIAETKAYSRLKKTGVTVDFVSCK